MTNPAAILLVPELPDFTPNEGNGQDDDDANARNKYCEEIVIDEGHAPILRGRITRLNKTKVIQKHPNGMATGRRHHDRQPAEKDVEASVDGLIREGTQNGIERQRTASLRRPPLNHSENHENHYL